MNRKGRSCNLIAITGGGTLGHVEPALAVAECLRAYGYELFYIGREDSLERQSVQSKDIEFLPIRSGKLRRYFSWQNFSDAFNVGLGFFQARRILASRRPAALFSKGGYVSFGPVLAAKILGIPVYSHESDSTPGLATRLNKGSSRLVFCGYEQCAKALRNGVYTGNPIRQEVLDASADAFLKQYSIRASKPILLVLGGSQGAAGLNDAIIKALDTICKRFFVVHQTGRGKMTAERKKDYLPLEFIENIGGAMKASSLCVSRSGAGTIAELSALGVPMVLVPLSLGASRGDQIENARIQQSLHKALVIDDYSLLVQTVMSFRLEDRHQQGSNENPAGLIARLIKEDLDEL